MNGQPIPVFKYSVLVVPSKEVVEMESRNGDRISALVFADQMSEISRSGKAAQLLVFPGFVLTGEIIGYVTLEQTIVPGFANPGISRENNSRR
ncbi:MAG: hypothetical protein ACREB3_00020 [Burkholderiales bacterium]